MVLHVDKVNLHQEMKRKFILDQLLKQGVMKNQEGKSLYDLSYEELKYEFVLQAFREIDAEKDENRWF